MAILKRSETSGVAWHGMPQQSAFALPSAKDGHKRGQRPDQTTTPGARRRWKDRRFELADAEQRVARIEFCAPTRSLLTHGPCSIKPPGQRLRPEKCDADAAQLAPWRQDTRKILRLATLAQHTQSGHVAFHL